MPKLSLNKETISNLRASNLEGVKGGGKIKINTIDALCGTSGYDGCRTFGVICIETHNPNCAVDFSMIYCL